MMDLQPQFTPVSRDDWRDWLMVNHKRETLLWVVFFKKHTGKAGLSYRDALEEALCFGWVDGLKRSIDTERYAYRFTPRRAKSKWSPLNIRLAQKQIDKGCMMPTGQTAFDNRIEYDLQFNEKRAMTAPELPDEMKRTIQANKAAWKTFEELPPSYRKQYVLWLSTAKKPETLNRRLAKAIELLSAGKRLGMK